MVAFIYSINKLTQRETKEKSPINSIKTKTKPQELTLLRESTGTKLHVDQWSKVEPYNYSSLIFKKVVKNINWKEDAPCGLRLLTVLQIRRRATKRRVNARSEVKGQVSSLHTQLI